MTRTDAELGWIAGFFDGEGYVGYSRSRPSSKSGKISPMLSATVPQNSSNIEVLEFFQSVVGFGKIYGPYATSNSKTRHDLKFRTDEVEPLYHVIKTYLKKEKTADFLRALEQYRNHNPHTTPDDVRRLSMLGCPKCKEEWNGMMCLRCGYN